MNLWLTMILIGTFSCHQYWNYFVINSWLPLKILNFLFLFFLNITLSFKNTNKNLQISQITSNCLNNKNVNETKNNKYSN